MLVEGLGNWLRNKFDPNNIPGFTDIYIKIKPYVVKDIINKVPKDKFGAPAMGFGLWAMTSFEMGNHDDVIKDSVEHFLIQILGKEQAYRFVQNKKLINAIVTQLQVDITEELINFKKKYTEQGVAEVSEQDAHQIALEKKTPLGEFILSYFDYTTGQFPKGETAVLTMIEKDYGEQYITPAKQFIERINNRVAEVMGYRDSEVEESGLQYYIGKKKYGKDGMKKLARAGRDGASQEELGRIKDQYEKESAELRKLAGL
jgi:hypothetical protein